MVTLCGSSNTTFPASVNPATRFAAFNLQVQALPCPVPAPGTPLPASIHPSPSTHRSPLSPTHRFSSSHPPHSTLTHSRLEVFRVANQSTYPVFTCTHQSAASASVSISVYLFLSTYKFITLSSISFTSSPSSIHIFSHHSDPHPFLSLSHLLSLHSPSYPRCTFLDVSFLALSLVAILHHTFPRCTSPPLTTFPVTAAITYLPSLVLILLYSGME